MNVIWDFEDQVAIVTGAGRGVGREIVRRFASAGARVVAADRDGDGLRESCATLDPEQVTTVAADVSDPAGATLIVQSALERFGGLDICVNNAAVAPHTSLLEERPEVWDTIFAVNCRGTFLMTQAAARAMAATSRGGRIINFSSGVTSKGSPGTAAYAASRAATEAFTRVAAVELAPYAILVNTISPGLIDTQPKPIPPHMAAALSARVPQIPLARAGTPGEVVDLVLFLASSASTYITGAVIEIDGGAGLGSRPTAPVVDDDPRYDWVTGRS